MKFWNFAERILKSIEKQFYWNINTLCVNLEYFGKFDTHCFMVKFLHVSFAEQICHHCNHKYQLLCKMKIYAHKKWKNQQQNNLSFHSQKISFNPRYNFHREIEKTEIKFTWLMLKENVYFLLMFQYHCFNKK